MVRAARRLIETHGLDALTMRSLAAALGVTPMALYRHVDSRQALIEGVIDDALDTLSGADPSLPLVDQLRQLDHQLDEAFGAMPDLALMLIRSGPTTARSVAFINAVVAGFVAAGLSEDEAAATYATLTTLALARVAMPEAISRPTAETDGRPHAARALAHLSRTDDTTVDLLRRVGHSLDQLENGIATDT